MTGKTHCAIGILSILIYEKVNNINDALLISGAVLGSLLPDIDNVSTISEYIPVVSRPWRWIHKATNCISKFIKSFKYINNLFDHRGITHSLLTPTMIYFLCNTPLLVGIAIGWYSHILIDLFNRRGCPLLMPIVNHHFHIASIKTSSKAEEILFSIAWIAILYIVSPITISVKGAW